jgi:glycosyltransferase involved in cell wall biosynthesis
VNAVVLTAGDPNALTGGSLHHRRVADRAARLGVEIDIRAIENAIDARRAAEGADVVVVDSLVARWVPAGGFDAPTVASVHQRPGGLVGRWPGRAVRAARDLRRYRRADAVVVPSGFLRALLVRAGIPARVLHVVEPGCDPFAVRPSRGDRLSGDVRFICVANLSAHKRPLDVVEAFARLGGLDASLTLIGAGVDPRLAERVRMRLEQPDVAGRARWLGPLAPADLPAELATADVFVLPALDESYGMAVAEAMRAGLPAIVARSGNLPNLVRDGVDGLVVAPRDVRALAGAMRALGPDRELRDAMARAASRAAERFPTWDDAAGAFCAVLRSAQVSAGTPRSAPGRSAA